MRRLAWALCGLSIVLSGCGDDDPASSANEAPQIVSGPTAVPTEINDNETAILSVTATDPDGDELTYSWTVAAGTISGTGALVTYDPDPVASQEIHTIDLAISDGRGKTTEESVDVTVSPAPAGARYRVRLDALNFVDTDCDGAFDSDIEAFWNIQLNGGAVAAVRPEGSPFSASSGNVLTITTAWAEADLITDGTGAITITGTLFDYDATSANDLIASWNLSFDANTIVAGPGSVSGGNPSGEGCNVVLLYTIEKMFDL